MTGLFWFIDALLGFYALVLIASVIISWLTAFGVVNTYQPFVRSLVHFLYAMTEPALGRIRRFLPSIGGIDISPIILWFAIYAVRIVLRHDIAPLLGVYGY